MDSSKDAAICPCCHTPYVIAKAINYYAANNTTKNIQASVGNVYGNNDTDFKVYAGSLKRYTGRSIYVDTPDYVDSIDDDAFMGCEWLKRVIIPDSVTSIGNNAFYGCSSLISIVIPDGVTSIGDGAFSGCSGITSITISDSVTSIGDRAFHGCSSLTSMVIPNSVTSIGDGAFSGCSGITSITISDSVTSIGDGAFHSCSSLTSIVVPDSVERLSPSAFLNSGLECISLYNNCGSNKEYSYGENCFKNLRTVIFLPGTKHVSMYMFKETPLEKIVFPNSIETIENWVQWKDGKRYHWVYGVGEVIAPPEITRNNAEAIKTMTGESNWSRRRGCYIATAVYGSYDCPEVWILRRFRDNTLAETWYGRVFVRVYYAVSPTLVKWFGKSTWFKRIWKAPLDKLVAKLSAYGVENTPYVDKRW